MNLDGVLSGITALIVKACDPESIMLFGSYAKGKQDADSDLDILVIDNSRESPFLRDRELNQLLTDTQCGLTFTSLRRKKLLRRRGRRSSDL